MKRKLLAALIAAALGLCQARAEEPAAPAGVVGPGAESCAAVNRKLAATPGLLEQSYFPWAQGYMSGVNGVFIANGHAYRELTRDPAVQQKFITDYCAKNPRSRVMDAVIALYQSRPITQ